jgi:outer membrane biosynthesis protein TonB
MEANFETQKNVKALGITIGICTLLALLLFLVSWTLPVVPPPVVDEGIEVNLGNSDQGLGDIAPAIPGEPSQETATDINPPPTSAAAAAEETKPVEENNDADATPINTPVKPSPKPKPKHTETAVTPKKTPQKVVNPTPAPPKPKAVYAGGKNTGTGGNNADSYNGVRNQGIAGGKGDQGKPNGNPNSDSYTGNGGSGKSGISIRSGLTGRRFSRLPSFEDDFNENAKVAVDITVNQAGTVTSATINPRGTTTTNSNIRNIARQKALQLKLNAGTSEQQTGTIVFDFKLKG